MCGALLGMHVAGVRRAEHRPGDPSGHAAGRGVGGRGMNFPCRLCPDDFVCCLRKTA